MFHVTVTGKLLVVDGALSAATDLIDGRLADFDVACLSSKETPLAQIAALVERMGPLSDLHILSHGEPGALHLAGAVVDAAALADAADALRRIAACLTPDAEVLLYGCSVASGAIGRDFVADLQDALGAPVAASEAPVGSTALGGAWSFRTADGMPAIPAFSPAAREAFAGLLATASLTTGNETPALTDGDDTINASIANSLSIQDVIDGKGGSDTLNITAAQALTLNSTTLTNVEVVKISHTTGSSVSIDTDDATVAAGQTLTVDGSAATGWIMWHGQKETDGKFDLTGGSADDTLGGGLGADTLTGGAGNDFFYGEAADLAGDTITDFTAGDRIYVQSVDLSALNGQAASGTIDMGSGQSLTLTGITAASGTFKVVYASGSSTITLVPGPVTASLTTGNDTPALGDGNDTINADIANSLNPNDVIDGKGGNDTLNITAEQGVSVNATTLTNVETVKISHTTGTVSISTHDGTVATGQTLTVDGSAATGTINWSGAQETDGKFSITGGLGNDTLRGGAGADTLTGGAGDDVFNGPAGHLAGDTITDFAVGDQIVVQSVDLTALNGQAATGTIDLGGGQTLTLTGISAASGTFEVTKGFSESYITLVAPVTFDLTTGHDTPVLGGGNDTINADIAYSLNINDVIDGKGGTDTLEITARQSVVFNTETLTNVETVKISHTSGTVAITTDDATVASGQTLTVDGSAATGAIFWTGSNETDGKFSVTGGSANDSLQGGAGSDTLIGGAGFD
ncbi:MAG: DUF4347 domain-containing protein, partial [Alphaproteobacteria bacterium]|nr:DUF4347 domain-containing protein [Alphaproteobacteria bacterium]